MYGARLVMTESFKGDDSKAVFKEAPGLLQRAFDLCDESQVLKYKDKTSYYLVMLGKIEMLSGHTLSENDKKLFLDREAEQTKMLTFNAFIASLLRRAKIEKYEKINSYEVEREEEYL
jgi:hypothetical protein